MGKGEILTDIHEMLKLEKTRNEILDKIVERASKREGQHILEIVNEIRNLCDELESTCIQMWSVKNDKRRFESIGSGMYGLIETDKHGYENTVFGVEYEIGKGFSVYNNEAVLDLEEMKQLRDLLNEFIRIEETYRSNK
jgi:hypothetical protein